jgi:hypothetical protein
MNDKRKKFLHSSLFIVGAILFFTAIYSLYPVFAAPPTSPYGPGDTLDPNCSPGDPNCSVADPIVTTFSASTSVTMGNNFLTFHANNVSNTLYIDGINSRVGLTTSSPLAELDVYGNIIISTSSGYLNFGSTVGTSGYGVRDNSGAIEYKDDAGSWTALNGLGGGSGTVNYAGAGSLTYYPSAGTTVTGTTSNLLYWDDNLASLGIGTIVPSTTLHVVSTTEQLRLGYNAGNYANFTVANDGQLTIASTGNTTTMVLLQLLNLLLPQYRLILTEQQTKQ